MQNKIFVQQHPMMIVNTLNDLLQFNYLLIIENRKIVFNKLIVTESS
jgi:hypothetical protein